MHLLLEWTHPVDKNRCVCVERQMQRHVQLLALCFVVLKRTYIESTSCFQRISVYLDQTHAHIHTALLTTSKTHANNNSNHHNNVWKREKEEKKTYSESCTGSVFTSYPYKILMCYCCCSSLLLLIFFLSFSFILCFSRSTVVYRNCSRKHTYDTLNHMCAKATLEIKKFFFCLVQLTETNLFR